MPRKAPPTGFITSAQATEILGVSDGMLAIYVRQGKLNRYGPENRKHKYYSEQEVKALADADKAFYESGKDTLINTDARFYHATQEDMPALYTMAVKLFPHTVGVERRQEWIQKEPRGHYVVKRTTDHAVVAYLYLLALSHTHIEEYLHGELRNLNITGDMVLNLLPGVSREIILGGIGSDPDVDAETRANYVAVLLRGIRKDLEQLGRQGIMMSHMYAFSETEAGIAMCARLGMSQWEPPKGKRCTFQLDIAHTTSTITRGYKQGLAQWNKTHATAREEAAPPEKQSERSKQRKHDTLSSDTPPSIPADLPAETLPLYQFAEQHGVNRRTLLDQVRKYHLAHIALPKVNRPGEMERYFTVEQQQAILAFWQERGTPHH